MTEKRTTKLVYEGEFAAEVEVALINTDDEQSPYLSLQDAYKLDDLRDALRRGDIDAASRLDCVFRLIPWQLDCKQLHRQTSEVCRKPERSKESISPYRRSEKPFDFVHSGYTAGDDPDVAIKTIKPYEELEITWWLENVDPWRWGYSWESPIPPQAVHQMEERIQQGPPKYQQLLIRTVIEA